MSWLYRQVLSLLTRPYSLKAADQEFAFQTSLFWAGISSLATYEHLFHFICFLLTLFVFILLLLYICQWKCFLLKTENRKFTTQNRILGRSTMLSIKAWVIIDNCIWPFYGRELWKIGICDYSYTSLWEGPTAKLTALQYFTSAACVIAMEST